MESIEQAQIRRRFTRALSTYNRHAQAQQTICCHLADLLAPYTGNRFQHVLEIGCGSGGFTRLLQTRCTVGEWTINDLCPDCQSIVESLFPPSGPRCRFLPGDAEQLPFPGKYDLIASASAFQWMKHLPAFFEKLADCLVPGGVLLFNTFAPGNLSEIRQLTGKGLEYPPVEQLSAWLLPHFRIVHREETTLRLTFSGPEEVLKHLKYTGVTATGSHLPWTRRIQAEFCRQYRALFSTPQQQVTLTYRPVYLLAVKKEK